MANSSKHTEALPADLCDIKDEKETRDMALEYAETSSKNNNYCYCLVNNIPENFHASDLRNFFASFIEEKKFSCFHFRHRPQLICNPADNLTNIHTDSSTATDLNTKKSLCALVRFECEENRVSFTKRYHNKFWMDNKGNDLNMKCLITRIRMDSSDELKFAKELNPPRFMPCGNIGTRNSHFLELIRECRLPPSLIHKLGIQFPVGRRYKKYSKVPFNYGTEVVECEIPEEEQEILTGKGHSISDVFIDSSKVGGLTGKHHSENERENSDSESGPDDDDDRCEDWERHEAFEDDPTTQARIKERLFEEEIELVWEKGGPGIVWYTDAQFWDEKRGGFDEKTADDLDIDMQGYYSADGGDKDARDMLEMRRSVRFQNGLESVSVFKRPDASKIRSFKPKWISVGSSPTCTSKKGGTQFGDFEKHSKGVGRKVMEKMGWKNGEGLGKSFVGITDAIESEGQNPRDKRGIGYYGEKLDLTEAKRPKKSHTEDYDEENRVCIGTVYDDPQDLDTAEPLLRSNAISYIKRYQR